MSIKELPMVASMAPMLLGPQAPAVFAQLKEPFDTYGKLAAVSCPTLVMHGDLDQIVAVGQAVKCHERLACGDKRLRRWEGAGHNDVLATNLKDWEAEVLELIEKAVAFDNAFPAGALVEARALSEEAPSGSWARVLGPQGGCLRAELPGGAEVLCDATLRVVHRNPFAVGAKVEAHSLSAQGMNGLKGTVVGRGGKDSDRIQVDFGEKGEKAVKHRCWYDKALEMLEESVLRPARERVGEFDGTNPIALCLGR